MAVNKKVITPNKKPVVNKTPEQASVKNSTIVKSVPLRKGAETKQLDFVFEKQNYILMIIGVAVIILGYILMVGGGSKDPNVFNTDIFDFRRLTLASIVILAGFAIEFFAIMKKPKHS